MRKLLYLAVSLAILGVLYWRIDAAELAAVLGSIDGFWFVVALSLFIPLTLGSAWRLTLLAPHGTGVRLWEATRLTLAASAMNALLPSKLGDITKAYFMRDHGVQSGMVALAVVVLEKSLDLLALLVWCVAGLSIRGSKDGLFLGVIPVAAALLIGVAVTGSPQIARGATWLATRLLPERWRGKVLDLSTAWQELQRRLMTDRPRGLKITSTSILLWLLHLAQIWIFLLALGARIPFVVHLGLAPLAILAGLLPFTMAGVGTRDAALVLLYAPYVGAPAAAALGLLCTLRYVIPALGGGPFFSTYLDRARAPCRAASEA